MKTGVYIGMQNTGDYSLVSTGDYINPITETFKLKDEKRSIVKDQDLYLIIYDADIEYVKVEVIGQMTTARCFLSWDGDTWEKTLVLSENIDTTGGETVVRPFKLRLVVDDFLDYFELTGETAFKTYKLRMMYL
jgi:hypothetical protein